MAAFMLAPSTREQEILLQYLPPDNYVIQIIHGILGGYYGYKNRYINN